MTPDQKAGLILVLAALVAFAWLAIACAIGPRRRDVRTVHHLADKQTSVNRVRAFAADRAVIETDWDAELRHLIEKERNQ